MSQLESASDRGSQKFKDLRDLCLYYVNYLEEEATTTEALLEVTRLKNQYRDKGILSDSFNGSSVLGFFNAPSQAE